MRNSSSAARFSSRVGWTRRRRRSMPRTRRSSSTTRPAIAPQHGSRRAIWPHVGGTIRKRRGCTGLLRKPFRTSGSDPGEEVIPINKARLIFLAVVMVLFLQALLLAVGYMPLGFFDGGGGE